MRIAARQELTTTLTAAEFTTNTAAVAAFETSIATAVEVEPANVHFISASDKASARRARALTGGTGINVQYNINVPVSGTQQAGLDQATARVNAAITAPTFATSLSTSLNAVPGLPTVQALPVTEPVEALWVPEAGTELLSSFEFTREGCLSSTFTDAAQTPLIGNIGGTGLICAAGSGVRLDHTEVATNTAVLGASQSIQALREALGQDYTMEMWLRAVPGLTSSKLVFSIGSATPPFYGCQFSLAVYHGFDGLGQRLRVTMCRPVEEGSLDTCSASITTSAYMLQPTHVALTESQGVYTLYINGVEEMSRTPTCGGSVYGTADWPSDNRMHLLGANTARQKEGWPGTMYKFAMHSNTLNATEVNNLFKYGFPNSRPHAHGEVLTIRENGEDGDHSLQPEFYDTPIPVMQLVQLVLNVSDVDDKAMSPLYDAARGALTKLQITSLPTDGSLLYHLNGSSISTVPTLVTRSDNAFAVRVRPPLDTHSVGMQPKFTFTFRAIDGIAPTLYSADATASVIVEDVNKPPIPTRNVSRHDVVSNIVTVLPPFAGTDEDGTVIRAGIAVLPPHGNLYDVSLAGVVSSTPLAMPSDGTPYRLQGFRVAYRHTGSQAGTLNTRGIFGNESFSFVVIDNGGLASRREQCDLSLYTALRAIPAAISSTLPVILRNQASLFALGGTDVSGRMDRDLYVRILRFPASGVLSGGVLDSTTSLHSIGSKLHALAPEAQTPIQRNVYEAGAPIYYHGGTFSVPTLTADIPPESIASSMPDSFEYELFTSDGAHSLPVTQVVEIRNVNHPTELNFALDRTKWPTGHVQVRAVGLVPSDGVPTSASISGFALPDPDLGADLIHVRVESTIGAKMSLAADTLPHLTFLGPLCRGRRWQCKGSGDTDSVMAFLATPKWAETALNGLTYKSTRELLWDNVSISVYDGAGGNCLDDSQGSVSLRVGCNARSVHLPIEVLSFAQPPKEQPKDLDVSSLSFLEDRTSLLISIAVLLAACCVTYRACYWACGKARAKFCPAWCQAAKPPLPPPSPSSLEEGKKHHKKGKKRRKGKDKGGLQIELAGEEAQTDLSKPKTWIEGAGENSSESGSETESETNSSNEIDMEKDSKQSESQSPIDKTNIPITTTMKMGAFSKSITTRRSIALAAGKRSPNSKALVSPPVSPPVKTPALAPIQSLPQAAPAPAHTGMYVCVVMS